MKLWIPGIIILFLIAGGLAFYSSGAAPMDPFRAISVPPPPESEVPRETFVPASGESSQRITPATTERPSDASAACAGTDATNFYCYEEHYVKLVKEKGINAAFADLKVRYQSVPYVVAQCHPLTHVIGREAALKFETPGEAYTQGDPYCWSGYYHGILETFLDKIGRENLPQEIDHVCDGIKGKQSYSFDYYNCVHGLGHGVMAITNTELFQSLELCELLTGEWERQSCASGVFMENVIVDNLNHVTKYLDPKRPLYPCTDSPEKFKNTCYLMQTSYILKVNGGNFPDTFAWCRKAEELYQSTCFQSLGRDASGRTSSDAARTKATCMLGADYFERSNCVIGAVKDFISYFHSDKEAKVFCASLEDEKLIALCDSTTVSYYAQF